MLARSNFPEEAWEGNSPTLSDPKGDRVDSLISDQHSAEIRAVQSYLLTYVDLLRLFGTPGQVLTVNDAGTAIEWVSPSGGGGNVDSVDGRTGVVTLDDLYDPAGAANVAEAAANGYTDTAISTCQPLDADLTALAGLTTASFGRSLLELTTALSLRAAAQLDTTDTPQFAGLGIGVTATNAMLELASSSNEFLALFGGTTLRPRLSFARLQGTDQHRWDYTIGSTGTFEIVHLLNGASTRTVGSYNPNSPSLSLVVNDTGISTVGGMSCTTAGFGFKVKEGTNACMGVATLSGGTVVVATNKVTANSRILLTIQSLGTVTAPKAIAVTARTAGTSFTITSADVTDTSVVAWQIFEPS